jgi:ABC-type multidrug transport system ATPase subunit
MLTGLIPPDRVASSGHVPNATIYGNSILTQLFEARLSMGVCPQHDVLFDNLTVREHILFFAQLKGYSYQEADVEATALTTLFHLQSRLDNTGIALSGGQKRKLSIAIAVCGGSKLVILDEPTAGNIFHLIMILLIWATWFRYGSISEKRIVGFIIWTKERTYDVVDYPLYGRSGCVR